MDSPNESQPLIFWDGNENPTRLIENVLPLLSKLSNVPTERLEAMISTAVLTVIKEECQISKVVTVFDENGIFHLKQGDHDLLPLLATGDRIVLWLSLLAVIRKVAPGNLRFILYHPFSRLDVMKRIRMAEFLKDNFDERQLILISSKGEFVSIVGV